MWKLDTFGNAPDAAICNQINDFVGLIHHPQRPQENPVFSAPGQVFDIQNVGVYPKAIEAIMNDNENLTSGWIPETQCFWVSTAKVLYVFHFSMSHCFSADVTSSVVSVAFISGIFVVFQENMVALFSQELKPLQNVYSMPKNVTVTSVLGDVVGCNDGALRKIIVNPSKTHATISGNSFCASANDPIIQICETKDYYVTLSLKSTISVFNKSLSLIHSIIMKSIIRIWQSTCNYIYGLDKSSTCVLIDLNSPKKPNVSAPLTMLPSAFFSDAIWTNGFMTAIDSTSTTDHITVIRFQPKPVYTTTARFGTVLAMSSTLSQVMLLTSSGVHTISQHLCDGNDEDLWCFSSAIAPVWNSSLSDIVKIPKFSEIIQNYFDSDHPLLSSICQYVLFILQDIISLNGSPLVVDFANMNLSEYFGQERFTLFSRLRKISFETQLTNPETRNKMPQSTICSMIKDLDCGISSAEQQVLSEIKAIAASKNVPSEFPIYIDFMYRYCYYDELIDCTCQWADAMYPDTLALAFENANFPSYSIDDSASFQLRLMVLEKLNPFLRLATKRTELSKAAADALKRGIRMHGTVFQYYVVSFFEDESSCEDVIRFDFPELLTILGRRNSKHFPALLYHRGLHQDAYSEYVRQSTQKSTCTIEERIKMLERAISIAPDGINTEQPKKLLAAAQVLAPYINEHPDVPSNIISETGSKLVQKMFDYQEISYALKLMSVLDIKRPDIVKSFIKTADQENLIAFIEYIREHPSKTLSEKDIAIAYYEEKGKEKSINSMREAGFSPSVIFDLLSSLFPSIGTKAFIDCIPELLILLDGWNNVPTEDKGKLSDFLCNLIVELDSRNEEEKASDIRERLGKCFIEDKWDPEQISNDKWDL